MKTAHPASQIILPKNLTAQLLFNDIPTDWINDTATVTKYAWSLFCLEKLLNEYALVTERDFPLEVPFGLRHTSQGDSCFDGMAVYDEKLNCKVLHRDCHHMAPYSRYWMTLGDFELHHHVGTERIVCVMGVENGPQSLAVEWTVREEPTHPGFKIRNTSEAISTRHLLMELDVDDANVFAAAVLSTARFLRRVDEFCTMLKSPYMSSLAWVFEEHFDRNGLNDIPAYQAPALLRRAACWVTINHPEDVHNLAQPTYRWVESFVTNLINSGKRFKAFCPFWFSEENDVPYFVSNYQVTLQGELTRLKVNTKCIPLAYIQPLMTAIANNPNWVGISCKTITPQVAANMGTYRF